MQGVQKFGEENIFLELKNWWLGRRPSQPINLMNLAFVSYVYDVAINN